MEGSLTEAASVSSQHCCPSLHEISLFGPIVSSPSSLLVVSLLQADS